MAFAPVVHVNTEGWGPTTLPEQYIGIPFSTFNKGEKVGKVADFVGREFNLKANRWRDDESVDPDKFNLVDSAKIKTQKQAFRGRWQRRKAAPVRRGDDNKVELKGKQRKYLVQNAKRGKQWRRPRETRRYQRKSFKQHESSVKIKAEWKVVEQFDLAALNKMQMQPPEGTVLKSYGTVYKFNDAMEKIRSRTAPALAAEDIPYPTSTSVEDPVIEDIAKEYVQSGKENVVFCTSEIMAHLMCSTRSVFPWDIYFTKLDGNRIFIDKRNDSYIEMLSVNENGPTLSVDDEQKLSSYNHQNKLSQEATMAQNQYRQQVLDKTKNKKVLAEENPLIEAFLEDEGKDEREAENYSVGYRYKKFDIGSVEVIARTEVHCAVKQKKKNMMTTLYALNEYDHKLSGTVDWREKIDALRGQVLAAELKNNTFKVSKWTMESLLAKADFMNIGFVSRRSRTDPTKHVILGSQSFDPEKFAVQINLNSKNAWGIFKAIIEIILKQNTGKYLLMKDPNKAIMRLYEVPMDSFQEDEEQDSDDEEEMSDEDDGDN